MQHWRDGIAMLDTTADWLLGKGLGRFPQSYYFNAAIEIFPGAIGLKSGTKCRPGAVRSQA